MFEPRLCNSANRYGVRFGAATTQIHLRIPGTVQEIGGYQPRLTEGDVLKKVIIPKMTLIEPVITAHGRRKQNRSILSFWRRKAWQRDGCRKFGPFTPFFLAEASRNVPSRIPRLRRPRRTRAEGGTRYRKMLSTGQSPTTTLCPEP